MAATENFANRPVTSVTSGGTDAPASGTAETWTVLSSASFPSASTGVTQFHVADTTAVSEIILVINVAGATWTVVRGAEGTVPVAHQPGFTVFQVITAGWLNNVSAGSASADWLNVVTQFGADPTGSTDSSAAVAAAYAAATSPKGVVYWPAGTYKIETGVTVATGQSIRTIGDGRWLVTVMYYGTGDCFRIYDDTTYSTRTTYGGGFEGITIDGTNAGAGSSGLHIGDMFQYTLDVAVMHFTGSGSKGIWFDNQYYWTEQCTGRIYAQSCATHVVFDNAPGAASTSTGSFDRADLAVGIDAGSGDGVVFQNGALIIDGALAIRGNFSTSSSALTNAVLRITGSSPAGVSDPAPSQIRQSRLDIQVEADGGLADSPSTIILGGSSNGIAYCYGVMDFLAFTAATLNSGYFKYFGLIVGDSVLAATGINANSQKITQMANGSGSAEAVAYGQLGSAAFQATSAFDAAGAASTAQSNAKAASLALAGGTMSGVIAMGSHKITGGSAASAASDIPIYSQIPAGGAVVSGQYLCTPTQYAPGTRATFTTASGTMAAVSSANINTGTFTAPASGDVVVAVTLVAANATTGNHIALGLAAHGTTTPMAADNAIFAALSASPTLYTAQFIVTGLTAGSAYSFDLMYSSPDSTTVTVYSLGVSTTTPSTTGGAPTTMTVQAV